MDLDLELGLEEEEDGWWWPSVTMGTSAVEVE
jgi:hypothetical protein